MTKSALILDTETTGLRDPKPCQIGYIHLQGLTSYTSNTLVTTQHPMYQANFNPGKPIEDGARAIHGLSDADVAGAPHHSSFIIPESIQYIIGHNIQFDAKALGLTGDSPYKFICTLKLSRLLWPDMASHRLVEIIREHFPHVFDKITVGAHTALIDCKLCLLIISHAMATFDQLTTWEELYKQAGIQLKAADPVPTVMPYGKYKGTPFSQIPQDYLEWLAGTDLKTPMRTAVNRALGLDN